MTDLVLCVSSYYDFYQAAVAYMNRKHVQWPYT